MDGDDPSEPDSEPMSEPGLGDEWLGDDRAGDQVPGNEFLGGSLTFSLDDLPMEPPAEMAADGPATVGGDGQAGDPPGDPAHPGAANASNRQLFRNVAFSYGAYVVGAIMSLVLTRVLLRHLGPSAYGLWIVLLAIVGYLEVLDVGVATALVQRVARMMAQGDTQGAADSIKTAWVFFGFSGLAAILVTTGLAPFLSSLLNLGSISPTVAASTLVILGFMIALMFLAGAPNAALFGSGRNDRLSQLGILALLLTQLGQILAALAGAGLVALAVIQTAGIILGLVMSAALVRRVTGLSLRQGRFRRDVLRELLRFGGLQALIALASVVGYQLDALVIGVILPVAQVAPYNVALNTSNFTRAISTQGTNLLFPTYAHFDVVEDRDRQSWYFFRSVLLCLVISVPILIALAAFGDPLLKLWLGQVPPKTYEIVIALGLVTALQLPGTQCFIFLTGVGRNRQLAPIALVGAVVNLAGSIVATYLWGPIGPALGSLPVVLVIEFTLLPSIVCRYLGVSFRRYAWAALAPAVPVAAVAGVTALLLVHLHPAHSGLAAVLGAAIVLGVAWASVLAVLFRLEPDLRGAVLQRLRRRRG